MGGNVILIAESTYKIVDLSKARGLEGIFNKNRESFDLVVNYEKGENVEVATHLSLSEVGFLLGAIATSWSREDGAILLSHILKRIRKEEEYNTARD